jgi:HprK-related kinase A
MTLSTLRLDELGRRVGGAGVAIRTGPFSFRLRSPISSVARGLALLYRDYPLLDSEAFVDFEVHIDRAAGLRRWLRPQVRFRFDGASPFEPLPVDHALPLLEWSMNWCISTQAHHYLTLHAAVIERDGRAAILPAPPGSGKSTLCAGLICRGWRLLSDELTLIDPVDLNVTALCRPVSLKNESLGVLREFEPTAVFSPTVFDTNKGAVSLMRVPAAHVARAGEKARPAWVVFPKYVRGSPPMLTPRPRASAMLELGRNAFNYMVLGRTGFEALAGVVGTSACFDFQYSRLEDAVASFDALAQGQPA